MVKNVNTLRHVFSPVFCSKNDKKIIYTEIIEPNCFGNLSSPSYDCYSRT